jgi:hypothetical protein
MNEEIETIGAALAVATNHDAAAKKAAAKAGTVAPKVRYPKPPAAAGEADAVTSEMGPTA